MNFLNTNVGLKICLGKQSKNLSLFEKCFWGNPTCLKHTKYHFKSNESIPFGKKYCDGHNILEKFCNKPDQMWTEAPNDDLGNYRDIYFENEKSLEDCNMIETLRQCDVGSERVYCDDSNIRSIVLSRLGIKQEENRGLESYIRPKWSNYISLGHGRNVR